MNENENLELLNSENVEGTTEETVEQVEQPAKTYTEEEVNQRVDELLGKKMARREAKIRKEYEKKYGELETVLKAGTGKEDVAEVTGTLRQFYESKGVQIPKAPTYSDNDNEVLAKAEAQDIIKAGFEDVTDELNRLSDIGVQNMSVREKALFKELAEYHKAEVQHKELSKIGVTEDVYNSKEFKEFASQFNSNTPITTIYGYYSQMQPKKDVKPMGSVRNTTQQDTGVKDFYTRDEALKFTKKDLDANPDLMKAIEKSMLKW